MFGNLIKHFLSCLVYYFKKKINFYFMYSEAWRRRRKGLKLRNRHLAQAAADVMPNSEVKDIPETGNEDSKDGDEAEDEKEEF